MFRHTLGVVLLSVLIASCGGGDNRSISSEGVPTSQVFATIQVIEDGDGFAYVETQLTDSVRSNNTEDSRTYLRLSKNDDLWFTKDTSFLEVDLGGNLFDSVNDVSQTHTKLAQAGVESERWPFLYRRLVISRFGVWYTGRVEAAEPSGEYYVSLVRDDQNTADDSRVVLPNPFSLVSPESGESFSRGSDDILVEWGGVSTNYDVFIDADTTCSDFSNTSYSQRVSEGAGTFVIPAGDLESPGLSGDCSTTISVRKQSIGQLDNRFFGGLINGHQLRRIVVTTTD